MTILNLTGMRIRASAARRDTFVLYIACRDHRVRWYAKALAAVIIAYAVSPVDLIPDFIPVLGYLDDLVLIPLGFLLVTKMIPKPLLAEFRKQATLQMASPAGKWIVAGVVIAIWVLLIGVGLYVLLG